MRIVFAVVLAALQAGSSVPLRFGLRADALTRDDLAAIDALSAGWGARPWLLWTDIGMTPAPTGGERWFVTVQLRPKESGVVVRRGGQFTVSEEHDRSGVRRWQLARGADAWAQVRVRGREWDDVRGENDINRPFATDLVVTDMELAGIVEMLREDPIFAAERSLPVESISRVFGDDGEYTMLSLVKGHGASDRYRMQPTAAGWQVKWLGTVAR